MTEKKALVDGHPRVRFAAMHAIGQTSTDHQPYVQENHGEKLMTVGPAGCPYGSLLFALFSKICEIIF